MTNLDDARRLTRIAAEAAQLVAEDLLQAFRSPMRIDYKRDEHDPVTEHDRRAEERIVDHLLAAFPDSAIIGEEGGSRGAGSVTWHVDPIDGTANFTHGIVYFGTSIGAVLDGQVVAGAITAPALGELYVAGPDGAHLNGQPLRAEGATREATGLMISSYPAAQRPEQSAGFDQLIAAYSTVRRTGSAALSLAAVAAGHADAALGTTVHSWDVCAGWLLVARAGGRYRPLWLDPSRQGPIAANDPWEAPGYLATVGTVEAVVAESLADELEAAAQLPVTEGVR